MADKKLIGSDVNASGSYSPSGVPTTGDNLTIAASSPALTTNLATLAAVVLGTVKIDEGHSADIGTETAYFQFKCARFECTGDGTYFINVGSSAISPIIRNTGDPAEGFHGLYLRGSALVTVDVLKGNVGIATQIGETATIDAVRLNSNDAKVWVGSGVTLNDCYVQDGKLTVDCEIGGTLTQNGGTVTTTGAGDVDTVIANDGVFYSNSTGDVDTLTIQGGAVDFRQSSVERTVNTLIFTEGKLDADASIITFGSRTEVAAMISEQRSRA